MASCAILGLRSLVICPSVLLNYGYNTLRRIVAGWACTPVILCNYTQDIPSRDEITAIALHRPRSERGRLAPLGTGCDTAPGLRDRPTVMERNRAAVPVMVMSSAQGKSRFWKSSLCSRSYEHIGTTYLYSLFNPTPCAREGR